MVSIMWACWCAAELTWYKRIQKNSDSINFQIHLLLGQKNYKLLCFRQIMRNLNKEFGFKNLLDLYQHFFFLVL